MSEYDPFAEGAFDWSSEKIIRSFKECWEWALREVRNNHAKESNLVDFGETSYWHLAWRLFYTRKVPKRWGVYGMLTESDLWDLDKADPEIRATLIDAALEHPNRGGLRGAYKNHELTAEQMAKILARRDLTTEIKNELYLCQIDHGLTDEKWVEAKVFSEQHGESLIRCLSADNIPVIACPLSLD